MSIFKFIFSGRQQDKILLIEGMSSLYEEAMAVQKLAKTPGCEEGFPDCLDQTCGCYEEVPSWRFLREYVKRAQKEKS